MIDWDRFRADYPAMTFQDKAEFYERVAELYPEQSYANLERAAAAFDLIEDEDLDVIELGGWDGTLAGQLLDRFPTRIGRWTNYDLLTVPQVCDDPRYHAAKLLDDFWSIGGAAGDVFVSTHMIEHIDSGELDQLLRSIRTRYCYLEAPLPLNGPVSWRGSDTAHVLDIGWDGVTERLIAAGFASCVVWFPLDLDAIGLPGVGAGLWRRA